MTLLIAGQIIALPSLACAYWCCLHEAKYPSLHDKPVALGGKRRWAMFVAPCEAGKSLEEDSLKNRATVICCREGEILLVARARARWSLPGGSIKRSESPLAAALRELEEETSLVGMQAQYLFHFGGLSKQHHVFFANFPADASPKPQNEIKRCEWFSARQLLTLSTSVPTREIVGLFVAHKQADELPPSRTEVQAEGRLPNDTPVCEIFH